MLTIGAIVFAVMAPRGKGAVVGFLLGEDMPLSWAYSRQFNGSKGSMRDVVRFFSEHPRAEHIRRRADDLYLTCSDQNNDFECGFDLPPETEIAIANVGAADVIRHEDGVVFFLGDEIRSGTHFLIGYVPLGPERTPIPSCSGTSRQSPRGACNMSLDSDWVLNYEWWPDAPFQAEQEDFVNDAIDALKEEGGG